MCLVNVTTLWKVLKGEKKITSSPLSPEVTSFLTLRLLTHLKEYLHFFDFHLPLPQLFLPGAFAVLVGVSGRSVFVPLSMLTASSFNTTTYKQLVLRSKQLLKQQLNRLNKFPNRSNSGLRLKLNYRHLLSSLFKGFFK